MAINTSSVKLIKNPGVPQEILDFCKMIRKISPQLECDPSKLKGRGITVNLAVAKTLIENARLYDHVVLDANNYKERDGITTIVHALNPRIGLSIWNDPFYKNGCSITAWTNEKIEEKKDTDKYPSVALSKSRVKLLDYLYPLKELYVQASQTWNSLIQEEQLNQAIDYSMVKNRIVPTYFLGAQWQNPLGKIAIDMAAHDLGKYRFHNGWHDDLKERIREDIGECNQSELQKILEGFSSIPQKRSIKITINQFVLPEQVREDEKSLYQLGYQYDGSQPCLLTSQESVSHCFYPTVDTIDDRKIRQTLANMKGKGLHVTLKGRGVAVTERVNGVSTSGVKQTEQNNEPTTTQIGMFYNMYKKPLNYLFQLLQVKRKSQEQKEKIHSLAKELRKVEKAFQKNMGFADSVVDLLINQRNLKLGKLEASFGPALSAAISLTDAKVSLFYNMHIKPLNYLFAMLRLPKKSAEQKQVIDDLVSGLRSKEKKYMTKNNISDSLLDLFLKQRKLRLP